MGYHDHVGSRNRRVGQGEGNGRIGGEAGRILRVSTQTVRRLRLRGELKAAASTESEQPLYDRKEVERLAEKRRAS